MKMAFQVFKFCVIFLIADALDRDSDNDGNEDNLEEYEQNLQDYLQAQEGGEIEDTEQEEAHEGEF